MECLSPTEAISVYRSSGDRNMHRMFVFESIRAALHFSLNKVILNIE